MNPRKNGARKERKGIATWRSLRNPLAFFAFKLPITNQL